PARNVWSLPLPVARWHGGCRARRLVGSHSFLSSTCFGPELSSMLAGTTGKRAYARGSEALLGVAEPKLPALGGHDEERVEALLACGWLEPRAGDVDRDVGNPRLALASPVTREALLRRRVEEITDHLRARGARRRDEGR